MPYLSQLLLLKEKSLEPVLQSLFSKIGKSLGLEQYYQ